MWWPGSVAGKTENNSSSTEANALLNDWKLSHGDLRSLTTICRLPLWLSSVSSASRASGPWGRQQGCMLLVSSHQAASQLGGNFILKPSWFLVSFTLCQLEWGLSHTSSLINLIVTALMAAFPLMPWTPLEESSQLYNLGETYVALTNINGGWWRGMEGRNLLVLSGGRFSHSF